MQKFALVRVTGTLALAAVLAGGAFAQKASSDAQVEANVLKAMAADTRLTNQPIQSTTAFGVVTLTGSVTDESMRDAAEKIASHTEGVKKVVDQLAVGSTAVAASAAQPQASQNTQDYDPAARNVLPGDEAAQASGASPGNQPYSNAPQQPAYGAPNAQAQGGYGYPQQQPPYPQSNASPQGNGYPQGGYGQPYPSTQQPQYPPQSYPQQPGYPEPGGYPQAGNYPPPPPPRIYRRDYERQRAGGADQVPYQPPYGVAQGQPGGQQVTIAPGVVLPVRITRWLSSGDAAPGSTFTAVVENDILANGLIAIPRGAEVQGTVIEAKGAGALKGRGSLTLHLNTLQLAGRTTPLQSDVFTVHGGDKAAQSINSAIGGAAVGALIGAVVGRGTGAAIGAGVGGAAGLGASAASGGGNAHIPAEALLQFRLTAPTTIVTASEAEMQRLGGYAGPEGSRRPLPAYGQGYGYPAPYPYVGYGRPYPGYYRGYYGY